MIFGMVYVLVSGWNEQLKKDSVMQGVIGEWSRIVFRVQFRVPLLGYLI